MGEELLQYCNVFFQEFDFILMLFYYVLVMFVMMGTAKMLLPEHLTQTNLTFYMAIMCLMLIWTNLGKKSFPTGYLRLTDETKVQVLFAVKTFFVVWALLTYTDGSVAKFLGLEIEKNHYEMNKRLNQIVALGGNEITIAPEFAFTFYAGFASLLSFTLVK